MKYFKNEVDFRFWFNRYFNDEIAYVKTTNHQVVFTTQLAISKLGLKPNINILEIDTFSSIKDEIIQIEDNMIATQKDALVIETLNLHNEVAVYCWIKKLVMIKNEIYILVEQSVAGELSARKLLFPTFKPARNYVRFEVTFSQQEQCILYFLGNNFTIEEIADILCITPGTVRSHVYMKIKRKFNLMGYEIYTREDIKRIAELLGYGRNMPSKIMKRIKPTSKILYRI